MQFEGIVELVQSKVFWGLCLRIGKLKLILIPIFLYWKGYSGLRCKSECDKCLSISKSYSHLVLCWIKKAVPQKTRKFLFNRFLWLKTSIAYIAKAESTNFSDRPGTCFHYILLLQTLDVDWSVLPCSFSLGLTCGFR